MGGHVRAGDFRLETGTGDGGGGTGLGANAFVERYGSARYLVGLRARVWLRAARRDLVWNRGKRLGTLHRRRQDLEELGIRSAGTGVAVRHAQRDRDARRHNVHRDGGRDQPVLGRWPDGARGYGFDWVDDGGGLRVGTDPATVHQADDGGWHEARHRRGGRCGEER